MIKTLQTGESDEPVQVQLDCNEKISEEEVEAAIGKMKLGKAAGPSECGGQIC